MRIDKYLLMRLGVESRTKAQWLIENKKIQVNGSVITKSSYIVRPEDKVVIDNIEDYKIGRGYQKLKNVVITSEIDFNGKVVLDIGASTGGFTACALDFGASWVYALDVGTNQLHASLKHHPRIRSMENTDIRNFDLNLLHPQPEIILMDVSFISILKIIPFLKKSAPKDAHYLILIKPQFETEKKIYLKKGIITSPTQRKKILERILNELTVTFEARIFGIYPTLPETAHFKNVEYFIHFRFKNQFIETS